MINSLSSVFVNLALSLCGKNRNYLRNQANDLETGDISFHGLPEEILFKIFSNLKEVDLLSCRQLNRKYKRIASDQSLEKLLWTNIIIDQTFWEKYFGLVGPQPPVPIEMQAAWEKDCPYWSGKKVKETHVLMLIPEMVGGQNLDLRLWIKLLKNPKSGNALSSINLESDINRYYGDQVEASHWVLLTKEAIPSSLGKDYSEQVKLIEAVSKKTELKYQVPHLRDLMIFMTMSYVISKRKLYSKERGLSRCQETMAKVLPAVIGMTSTNALISMFSHQKASSMIGVGAQLITATAKAPFNPMS